VLRTIFAPSEVTALQAADGSWISVPFRVQPVSEMKQALELQTPVPPTGNCNARLSVAGFAPSGTVTTQLDESTVAGIDDPKHLVTSKQPPAPTPASLPASWVPVSGVDFGTGDAGTTEDWQDPLTQVCRSGHVETTSPASSFCAVPTHK
jgi:hypothetical protein